ncbi:MAG: hypothetical protein ACXACH_07290 [Candidatus Hermodarchaeia archaeon]
MAGLGKLDVTCIAFMAVIILTVAGYMAVFGSWAEVDGLMIWSGWVWWVVIGIIIASLLVIIISSRRRIG